MLLLLFQTPILIAVVLQINETVHFFQRNSCLVGNFNHNLVLTSHGSSSKLPNNVLTMSKDGHGVVARELNKWKQLCELKHDSVSCTRICELKKRLMNTDYFVTRTQLVPVLTQLLLLTISWCEMAQHS